MMMTKSSPRSPFSFLRSLTRRHHVTGLQEQITRLQAETTSQKQQLTALRIELAQAQEAITRMTSKGAATRLVDDGKAPAPASIIRALNLQLIDAKAEIAFRTALWQSGNADMQALGFGDLHFTPRPGAERRHRKTYTERLTISGLEARRACWLELSCLNRLQDLPEAEAALFPRPLALDRDAPALDISWQGWSLHQVPQARRARLAAHLRPQITDIAARLTAALERARVVHLDLNFSGDNLTLDRDGNVSLIDFDIATLDDRPISAPLQRRLAAWQRQGGYAHSQARITWLLRHFCADQPA